MFCLKRLASKALKSEFYNKGLGILTRNIKPGASSNLNERLPVVAIVGRPNVGKSALFNRLIKRNEALVFNTPDSHVTRDYRYGIAALGDLRFNVVDTSGLEPRMNINTIQARATCVTKILIKKCDAILFMLDGRENLTSLDCDISDWIKRSLSSSQKVFVVANKCEKFFLQNEDDIYSSFSEFVRLGYGYPIPISAETGDGMVDLFSLLQSYIDQVLKRKESQNNAIQVIDSNSNGRDNIIKVAIMGLPNVGKSTLMNYLLKYERSLTGPEAGLTRDSVCDTLFYNNRVIELIDTAGWIKSEDSDKYDEFGGRLTLDSSRKARKSLNLSSIVVLMIDAEQIFKKDMLIVQKELKLACEVLEEKRVLIIAINKIDLVDQNHYDRIVNEFPKLLSERFFDIDNLKCVHISSKTGEGVDYLLSSVILAFDKWNKKLPTSVLNTWLQENIDCQNLGKFSIPALKRIKFLRQSNVRPPTFTLWVSGSEVFSNTEKRTFINAFSKGFDIEGIPIRVNYKYNKKWAEARKSLSKKQKL